MGHLTAPQSWLLWGAIVAGMATGTCPDGQFEQDTECVNSCSSAYYKRTATACAACTSESQLPCPFGVLRQCGDRYIADGTLLEYDRACRNSCTDRAALAGEGTQSGLCLCLGVSQPACAVPGTCEGQFTLATTWTFDRVACDMCFCSDPCPTNSFLRGTTTALACDCPATANWTCTGSSNCRTQSTISGTIHTFEPPCAACKCSGPACPAGTFLDKNGRCRCPLGFTCSGSTCETLATPSVSFFMPSCTDCNCSGPLCGDMSAINAEGECVCQGTSVCRSDGEQCRNRTLASGQLQRFYSAVACTGEDGCRCEATTTTTTTTTTTMPTTTTVAMVSTTVPSAITAAATTAAATTTLAAAGASPSSDSSVGQTAVVAAASAGAGALLLVILAVLIVRKRADSRIGLARHDPTEYFNPVYAGTMVNSGPAPPRHATYSAKAPAHTNSDTSVADLTLYGLTPAMVDEDLMGASSVS